MRNEFIRGLKFISLILFAFFCCSINALSQAQTCPTEMSHYWMLDDSAAPYADYCSGTDATCTNCPTPTPDSKVGSGAQDFNGTDEVNAADDGTFDWASDASFSIELWMKTSESPTDNRVIVGRDDPSRGLHWWVGFSSTGLATFVLFNSGGGEYLEATGDPLNDGAWHHVAAVRDEATGENRIYVDGVLIDYAAHDYTSDFGSTVPLNIGYLNTGGHYRYNGILDEVALWDKALSETEIRSHYYLGRSYIEYCGTPVKIMPIGDSITTGIASGAEPPGGDPFDPQYWVSYRKDLWQHLNDSGYDVDFVGSLTGGDFYTPPFDPDHDGHTGVSDDWMAENIYNGLLDDDSGLNLLAKDPDNPPDVLLLHIGTNYPDTSEFYVEEILNEVDQYEADYNTDVTVIIARIVNRMCCTAIPSCDECGVTTTFNDNVEDMVQNRIADGDKLILVDLENGAGIIYTLQPAGDMAGDLHPYASGYEKMSAVWYDALTTFLPVCVPTPPAITSTPVTKALIGRLYNYDVDASAYPEPAYYLNQKPDGMTINPVTGLIDWTPAAGQDGPHDVEVEAANSEGSAFQNFTVNVLSCPLEVAHYWKLDETGSPTSFLDSVGTNDAYCTNCPEPASGIVDTAQNFNGTDEVNAADDGTFDWAADASFSIELWMQTSATPTDNNVIVGRDDPSAGLHWWVGYSSTGLVTFALFSSGGGEYLEGTGDPLNDGLWHHIAAVRDDSTGENRLYVDGELAVYAAHDYTNGFGSAVPLNIGYLNSGGHYRYNGILDEVALWDKALSIDEIEAHYNRGLSSGAGYCAGCATDDDCDDGVFCNGTETCDLNNVCQPGTAPNCDDGVGCTDDSCDAVSDACLNNPNDSNCDDTVGCTDDTCDPINDCQFTPNDGICDNGLWCDGAETCDALLDCQGGSAPDCNDSVSCTDDSCNEGTDSCNNIPNNALCDNNLWCDGAETCDALLDCQGGSAPDCTDSVACTDDSCNEATDSCNNIPNNGLCDNGLWCDGAETCDAALGCQNGSAPDCNDSVACTDDSCNEGTDSCDNAPDNASCDNGLWCDGAETCDALLDCQSGSAPDCTDTVACTDDSCNEGTDSCNHLVNDFNCDDDDYCTGVEYCNLVSDCQSTGNPCDPMVCDDVDDLCTGSTVSLIVLDSYGTPGTVTLSLENLEDEVSEVSFDLCDPEISDWWSIPTGTCELTNRVPQGSGSLCSITDPTPDDGCISITILPDPGNYINLGTGPIALLNYSFNPEPPQGDVAYLIPYNTALRDATGDKLNVTPYAGILSSGCQNNLDCNDYNQCTSDTCNAGLCEHSNLAGSCDDALYCTVNDTCVDGTCEGSSRTCSDGITCTDDSCNEGTDSCNHIPNNGLCDNTLWCDGAETCDALLDCQGGTAPDCNDSVSCTDDSCNEGTDSCNHVPNNGLCDNNLWCDGAETCDALLDCQGGTAPDCNDSVSCTDDSCNEGTDSCNHVPNNGLCDNNLWCDGAETCDAALGCQNGSAPDCNDTVACTDDSCNEGTDSCNHIPNNGLCDNGLWCDGVETCDAALGCQNGSDPDCNDSVACTDDSCNEGTDSCDNIPNDTLCPKLVSNCIDETFLGRDIEISIAFTQGFDDGQTGGSDDITAISFTVFYDPEKIIFDGNTDADGDGIPDAVMFNVPATHTPEVILNEVPDGEINISIVDFSTPLSLLPDTDDLVKIAFTVREDIDTQDAEYIETCVTIEQFSFSDTLGTTIPGTTSDCCPLIFPCILGNCNGDANGVDIADAVCIILKIAEGAPYAPCYDANCDGKIDISDAVAVILIIAGQPTPCDAGDSSGLLSKNGFVESSSFELPSLGATGDSPALEIEWFYADPGENIEIPINFTQGSDNGQDGGPDDITAINFAIDYDQENLIFDPTDADEDGIPDSITFNMPSSFTSGVILTGNPNGEISISIVDFFPPLALLPSTDDIVNIEFELIDEVVYPISICPVVASFSDSLANSIPGEEICGGSGCYANEHCQALNDQCNDGICTMDTQACVKQPKQDGTFCYDGNPTTQNDICINGICQGSTPQQPTTTTSITPSFCDVVISPSFETAKPGNTITFNALTTCDELEVEGNYEWAVTSMIGSSIDETTGLYTAAENNTDSDVADTILVTDIDNGDITASASVTVEKNGPPPFCDTAIEPSTSTIDSEGTITFTASITEGKGCLEPDYTWQIDSDIYSQITPSDSSCFYQAGNNDTGMISTDTITVIDNANRTETEATITVLYGKIVSVFPKVLLSSRWIPLPYFMLIIGEDTEFNDTSYPTFTPDDFITTIGHIGLGNMMGVLLLISRNAEAGTVDLAVTTTNGEGQEVTFTKERPFNINLLPFILDESEHKPY